MTTAGEEVQEHPADRGHAGAGSQGILGAFEIGELQLQAADGRVAVPRIVEVGCSLAPGLDAFVGAKGEGGVLVDRHAVRPGRGIGGLAGVDAASAQAAARGQGNLLTSIEPLPASARQGVRSRHSFDRSTTLDDETHRRQVVERLAQQVIAIRVNKRAGRGDAAAPVPAGAGCGRARATGVVRRGAVPAALPPALGIHQGLN